MTNKPMLSVERELIRRIADHCKFWVGHPYLEAIADVEVELRALLDKSPTGWMPCSPNLLESGVDCATSPRWSSKEWDGHSHWHPARAAPHQGDPVAWLNVATGHVTTSAVVVMDWDDEEEQVQSLYAEQPAQVADQAQCEECKGWGYHENHHEGGGTECGECDGSGNATVAATVAVVMPDVDELAQIIRKVDGSHTLGAGSLAEAIIEEVSRLNGVKP